MKPIILFASLLVLSCAEDTITDNPQEPRKWILATGWAGTSEFEIPGNGPNWGPFNLNNFESIGIDMTIEVTSRDSTNPPFLWYLCAHPLYSGNNGCYNYLFFDTTGTSGTFHLSFPGTMFSHPNEEVINIKVQSEELKVSGFIIYGWLKP